MTWAKLVLTLIILTYLIVGALYAAKTPNWQVPDEPAHYNYIQHLAQERPFPNFPILEMGDYQQAYLDALRAKGFPPSMSLQGVEYEDHQPPLYYLLATPVYWLFGGELVPLRLFSLLLGIGVILAAYAVATVLYPRRPLIALGTAAFVAFLPQHVAMMAGVNNDGLAELFIGLVLWVAVRWVPGEPGVKRERRLFGLGLVLGLGLLTKATVYPVTLPAVALAVILAPREMAEDDSSSWKPLARDLLLVFGPALLLGLTWWLRNLAEYGGLDVLGLANHDAVVVGQPRTADWIDQYGLGSWLERGVTFTFQSFWGQFGWMGVLMPTWLYRGLAVWSGLLLLSWGLYVARGESFDGKSLESFFAPVFARIPKRSEGRWAFPALQSQKDAPGTGLGAFSERVRKNEGTNRRRAPALLATTLIFALLAYAYYNRTFVQHQGRYLYPALIPIALGVALATNALVHVLGLPQRLHALAFAAPYVAMVALDLYALWRLILPALT